MRWPRAWKTLLRSVEPQMRLPGTDGILIFAVLPRCGSAVALTDGSNHHQVVPKASLGLESVILRHGFQHSGVITGREPFQALEICRRRLGREDVFDSSCFMVA